MNDHGVRIPITKDAYLEVTAAPWITETRQENLDKTYKLKQESHQERGDAIEAVSRTTTLLNQVSAAKIHLKYRDAKTGTKMIEEGLICLPQDEAHGSTIFEVYLVTPEPSYSKHKLLLDSLLRSWRWRRGPVAW